MADPELDALRQKRLGELQKTQGGGGGGGGAAGGFGGYGGSEGSQEEARRQQQDMKNSMLAQLLSQEARARLNTLAITKPEKAAMVENTIISMARSGQIMNKLTEDQLIGLLERVNEQTQKKTVVKYDRRRCALDSDDD